MKTNIRKNKPTFLRLKLLVIRSLVLATLILSAKVYAQPMGQLPEIPAFLPMAHTVPASTPMSIDGVWRITSMGKRIRIEGGRAYAIDSWLHLFVLKIQPNMVVIKNIRSAGRGRFSGDDLPLMGKWQATRSSTGALEVTVAGTFGPVRYRMEPIRLDRPSRLPRETDDYDSESDNWDEDEWDEDTPGDEDDWDEDEWTDDNSDDNVLEEDEWDEDNWDD